MPSKETRFGGFFLGEAASMVDAAKISPNTISVIEKADLYVLRCIVRRVI